MAHSSTTMDMTKGSIWKSLFLFSLPLLLGNLFQQLYSTVDSLVVGNFLGAYALGAVTCRQYADWPFYGNQYGGQCHHFPILWRP